jgi:hypothetical protein
VFVLDDVFCWCCGWTVSSCFLLLGLQYVHAMPKSSINLAAEYPDESFCDMTAHINDSIDSVKMKRLKSVR